LPEKIRTPEDLERAAEAMRRAWELGQDPILDMVDALEQGGIWVFLLPVDAEGRMNGICALADDVPVVAVAETWPGDRQRFTLAHELGHLVLEGRLDPSLGLDEEKACHQFAGAFILPQAALVRELGLTRRRLEWRELAALKVQFGLSMAACLLRARAVGILSEDAFSRLFAVFSKQGWRKAEPVSIGKEQAHAFEQLVFHALAEGLVGEAKAAELLGMSLADFLAFRTPKAADANTAHQ
jgi:Zn-dependent peptidase ImmA (M78 family)